MTNNNYSKKDFYEAEVIDSTVVNEGILKKILVKAGRTLAQPAFEAFEMMMDTSIPTQVRLSMFAALTYLVMPVDLMPDFIPVAGFSDDLVALSAAITLWQNHMTPAIKQRARQKLDRLFPL
tara:strand:- start:144 stop:509 length:366 start_codon:yes stop_codon:yes gene_type:complete